MVFQGKKKERDGERERDTEIQREKGVEKDGEKQKEGLRTNKRAFSYSKICLYYKLIKLLQFKAPHCLS